MTPDELALRYVGISERPGVDFNAFIAAWISDARGEMPAPPTIAELDATLADEKRALEDETPWCGAFVYHVAHRLLGLEAPTQPLRARSWLGVGETTGVRPGVGVGRSLPGDAVVLTRGPLPQPGPEVEQAPGHVGFLLPDHLRPSLGLGPLMVPLVSGNVADAVTVSAFPISRVLGVRRLRPLSSSKATDPRSRPDPGLSFGFDPGVRP